MKLKSLIFYVLLVGGVAWVSGCSTPQTRIAQQPDLFNRLTPEQQQLIREGKVGIGFDMDMVKLAIGEPDRIHERIDATGKSEVWSYVQYEGSGGVLLYRGWYHRGWGGMGYPYYLDVPGRHERARDRVVFHDGKVVSIETEKR